ncbi:MAG: chemotaxis response regulator protein-glutamate methylesterase [Cytophagales bacterium]|nr:chemotaxis response regulator protein-glutamate methylesterase [Cytophagales bacterium]
MNKKINVLVVDDSAMVRQTLSKILNSDSGIHVLDTAADPIFAAKKIVKNPPDVITLDIEMPRMNGLTFLKKLMVQFPLPVVIISSLTDRATDVSLQALEMGAVEVITKPRIATREFFEESGILICDAIKAAAATKIKKTSTTGTKSLDCAANDRSARKKNDVPVNLKNTTDKVIAIGASTGGTNALLSFLRVMSPDCPGIVIVQHMPELFTKSFADRLNNACEITVKEGVQGEPITPGKAIIAPGNKHMLIGKSGAKYYVDIKEGPLVNRHRPSVNVLFRSVAKFARKNAFGIIMTGMGDDGAKGLLEMKQAGAYTIAQDEQSSVVFGMPKKAIEFGAVHDIVSLDDMAGKVTKYFS